MSAQRYIPAAAAVTALALGGLYFRSGLSNHGPDPDKKITATDRPFSHNAYNPSLPGGRNSPDRDSGSDNTSSPSPNKDPKQSDGPAKDSKKTNRGSGTGLASLGFGQKGEQPVKDTRIASNLNESATKKAPKDGSIPADKASYRSPEGKDEGVHESAKGPIGGGKKS
jgi:hypothetical protein